MITGTGTDDNRSRYRWEQERVQMRTGTGRDENRKGYRWEQQRVKIRTGNGTDENRSRYRWGQEHEQMRSSREEEGWGVRDTLRRQEGKKEWDFANLCQCVRVWMWYYIDKLICEQSDLSLLPSLLPSYAALDAKKLISRERVAGGLKGRKEWCGPSENPKIVFCCSLRQL